MTRRLSRRAGATGGALVVLGLLLYLGILQTRDDEPVKGAAETEPPAKVLTAADLGRVDEYQQAMKRARAWFDQLEVDPVELLHAPVPVKGKKKLSEIISVYKNYLRFCKDSQERQRIMERLREFAWHANRPEYHDIAELYEKERTGDRKSRESKQLVQNSMSYFRVPFLLEQIGFDMSLYREEIAKVKPLLDAHMERRGPWQRAMFAEYYDHFGLEKPEVLRRAESMDRGVVKQRTPLEEYDRYKCYALTHEVFVAYVYGEQRTTDRFTAEDRAYLRQVLGALIEQHIEAENADLVAELVSSLTYLGFHEDDAYRAGIDFLLDRQNEDGSWGDYEEHREAYGKYLDAHLYLHTTMVVVQSLMEAYEGNWETAPGPPNAG